MGVRWVGPGDQQAEGPGWAPGGPVPVGRPLMSPPPAASPARTPLEAPACGPHTGEALAGSHCGSL